MSDPLDGLRLDDRQLHDVRTALFLAIAEGLEHDGRAILALPAQLPPPPPGLSGEVMVVDCGGTNIRAALVEVDGKGGRRVVRQSASLGIRDLEKELAAAGETDGSAFFRRQAELVRTVVDRPGLPLGYCFSFPAAVDASRDATLITFTKDLAIPGVVGTRVGSRLAAALGEVGLAPSSHCVLNDTVAALIGGAGAFGGVHRPPGRFLGMILGTGTNSAGFFSSARAPKLARAGFSGSMAINLETANFTPPHLTGFDEALDRGTERPGHGRLEKAVSGRYLPFLFKAAMPGHPLDPEQGSGPLTALRDDPAAPGDARRAAGLIVDRSADLTAASLAGLIDHYGEGDPVTILGEGSLLWKTPGFSDRMMATLRRLLGQVRLTARVEVELHQLDAVNLFGSAYAALTPA